MRALRWTAAAAVLLLGGGAACSPRNPVKISPERQKEASYWTARLATPAEMQGALQVQGTATIAPNGSGHDAVVEVHLSNVAPGGVHPWKVQAGQCGSEGEELIKVTDDGRMLKVNGSGEANASAKVQGIAAGAAGDYAIVVLASPDNQQVVIACGNFAPPPASATETSLR